MQDIDPSGATIYAPPQPLSQGFAMRREELPPIVQQPITAETDVGRYGMGYQVGQVDPRAGTAVMPHTAPYPLNTTPEEVARIAYAHPMPVHGMGAQELISNVPRETMARIQGDPYALANSVYALANSFGEATKQLQLSPQEQFLYQQHLKNLSGTGKVIQPNGSISTLLQAVVRGPDGRFYNIPTVWNGQVVPWPLARQMAAQMGWDKWPGYRTPQEADQRYQQMHMFIDRDTANYREQSGQQ